MRRLPVRVRLAFAFAGGMAPVLAALGLVLHARLDAALTNGIDMELRSRAQVVVSAIRRQDPSVIAAGGNLIDPDEAFAQVLTPSGGILDSSPGVEAVAMVPPAILSSASRGPVAVTATVGGLDDPASRRLG